MEKLEVEVVCECIKFLETKQAREKAEQQQVKNQKGIE